MGLCHGTSQLPVLGRYQAGSGLWHLQKICAGQGCSRERWLRVKFDQHLLSKQLLLMFPGNGLSSRSSGCGSSVFLRQVGWLAAQACDTGLRKEYQRGDEAGSSEQGWGKPHHESHIKQSVLNVSFPPRHGRKTG